MLPNHHATLSLKYSGCRRWYPAIHMVYCTWAFKVCKGLSPAVSDSHVHAKGWQSEGILSEIEPTVALTHSYSVTIYGIYFV